MKKLIFIFLFNCLFGYNSYSQQWVQLPQDGNAYINSHSVSFPTPDIGYGGHSNYNPNLQFNKTRVY